MKIVSTTPEITFNDVLLLPGYSDFTITEDTSKTNISTRISKNLKIDIPICSAPMPHVTEVDMAIAMGKIGGIGFIHCFQSLEKQLEQVKRVKDSGVKVAVSVSDFSANGLKHVQRLLSIKTDLICVETAHAFNYQTIEFIKSIKEKFPKAEVCASLVVTAEATEALIKAGADSIRVGIGGGSHCTTRLVTASGRPQLSAVLECSKVAKKYNVPIISDTGIEYPGDIAKAIAFGADSVMIGGLFTGTDECPGQVISKNGKKYKFSAGMCSDQTQFKSVSGITNAINAAKSIVKRTIKTTINKQRLPSYAVPFRFTHEGVSGLIGYKGSVVPIVNELSGGLRRSMWYLGAKNISDIQNKTEVVVTTSNTTRDNVPRI